MTTESRLVQLPKELFDNIITQYLHSVHVHDASATRAVSKLFDQAIRYQIVNQLPTTSFCNKDMSSDEKKLGWKVLRCMFVDVLRSPVRKTRNDPFITSIYTCAEAVLTIEDKVYDDEVKTRYVEDIVQYVTLGGMYTALRQVLHPKEHLLSLPSQDLFDLTGAAAVGSLVAVKYLLEKNPASWPSQQYPIEHVFGEGVFSDPLQAAASNGHVDDLQHLFNVLEAYETPVSELRVNLSYRFQCTLSAAIQSKHCPSILILAKFFKKHKIPFDLSIRDCNSFACAGDWINTATKTGCVKTYQTTISAMMIIDPSVYESESDYLLELALVKSCAHGQVDLLRHLIAQNPALLTRFGHRCMQSAAKYLHRSIIDVLLEKGVSIDHERPIWFAIAFENLSMVKFMIARGAKVDGIVYGKCLTKLENRYYGQDLRTFATTSMMPVIFYLVAKLVEKKPVFPEGKLDRLAHLVEDIEDSEFWSGKVEAELGM